MMILILLAGAQAETIVSGWARPGAQAETIMVPMRDGMRLATDVTLPTGGGKLPAILLRSPYGKNGDRPAASYFSAKGYAFVAQDTRGRYDSEGEWRFLADDGRDGYDTVEWIAKQPWSDGKIGMMGTSYVGGTQHAAALERPPHLVTAIPVDAVSNMGVQGMRNGGAFELRFLNWIFSIGGPRGSRYARDPTNREMLRRLVDSRREVVMHLPLWPGETLLKNLPEYEGWLVEAMRHGANDAFWDHVNVLDHPDRYQDMPLYLVGGWYDSWAGNTTANYRTLAARLKSPVYLILGPWIHGGQGRSAHGQVSFGPDAAIPDPLVWRLEWFDRWLKGVPNRVGREAPFAKRVRIFVMGTGDERKDPKGMRSHGGFWRDEEDWPLARTRYVRYYFRGGGGMGPEPPESRGSGTSFEFDPKNPVPTVGGNISSGDGLLLQGAWHQAGGPHVWNCPDPVPLSDRKDVVVFQTQPLAADMEVTGELEVKLWASSTAPDTDFTAKLVDAHPDGFDQNIADGIVRARFRDSLKQETLMEPGRPYEFTIRMYPTSNVFKKGHRIRVDVSSSNFPRFDPNPNSGEPLNQNRRWVVATNTIYHDRSRPSAIVLPVIP